MLGSVARFLWNNKFDVGFGVFGAASDYQTSREEGKTVAGSVASAAVEGVLPYLIGMPLYMGYELATEAPSIGSEIYHGIDSYKRKLARESRNQAFQSAHFDETQQTYTMRQAGLEIAKRSQYNIQQAMLGNEARYMMK